MLGHGTRIAQCCTEPTCRRWDVLTVEGLIGEFGENHMLWDRRPPCRLCEQPTHYMASPGPSTPYVPLLSGLLASEIRRQFLKSFGFTKRDVRRIQAMAELVDPTFAPQALDDLDVPYRVGAIWPGQESRSTGKYLGEWKGRTLLFWGPMEGREHDVWRQNRRTGPKAMPSRTRKPRP
jgi:hypothetical protein